MNLLSFLGIVSATYLAMLAIRRATHCKPTMQNIMAITVLGCLAWWCLCDAFFYVAPTVDVAWFWHRTGAAGWCGFIAATSYYFLTMTGKQRQMPALLKVLFWGIAAALILRFTLAAPTGLADELVQSGSGLGWTFVLHYTTPWPYILFAYAAVYLGSAFIVLYRWQKHIANSITRRLAKGFLMLDAVALTFGILSLFVVPYFTSFFPPLGFVAAMIFGIWYWVRLNDLDFSFIELALNPSFVYESCIDGLLVVDTDNLVLYANSEARRMMGCDEPVNKPFVSFVASDYRGIKSQFEKSSEGLNPRFSFVMKNEVPVVCSINCTQARRSSTNVYVVHLSDITQVRQAQDSLKYLAYHDAITGIHNRRYLDETLETWCETAKETGTDFELLFIDVTNFKLVNDTFGHVAGDEALKAIANALVDEVGQKGEVVRFAGDEFVVLGHCSDDSDLSDLSDSLVRSVDEIDTDAIAEGLELTIDVGTCRYSETGKQEALLLLADRRMYERKRARAAKA